MHLDEYMSLDATALAGGCDSLIWPQGDGLKWLHLRGGGVSL